MAIQKLKKLKTQISCVFLNYILIFLGFLYSCTKGPGGIYEPTTTEPNLDSLGIVIDPLGNYNWLLHCILTLVTIIWGFIWYYQYKNHRKRRIRISYDNSGNYLEEKINL